MYSFVMTSTVAPGEPLASLASAPTGRPERGRPRRPWLLAVLFALVPVLFTAAGSAAAQILRLSPTGSTLVVAAAATVSAGVAVVVMVCAPSPLAAYGLRRPENLRGALWLIPAAATVLIALATQATSVTVGDWLPLLALVIAVALNEELWFRGLILSVLRVRGQAAAVYGSAGLFGVLHLANLAAGDSVGDAAVQLIFAVVFGLVAAQLVVLTRSLWPVIGWHVAWNYVNLLSGNQSTPLVLAGVALATAVIVGYAIVLGRRLRAGASGTESV